MTDDGPNFLDRSVQLPRFIASAGFAAAIRQSILLLSPVTLKTLDPPLYAFLRSAREKLYVPGLSRSMK